MGILPSYNRLVVEGDSITAGNLYGTWVGYAVPSSSGHFTLPDHFNQAVGGETALQMTIEVGAVNALVPDVVTLLAGTNDLSSTSSTPQTIYGYLKTEWKAYLDAGASYVVAVEVLPRADSGWLLIPASRQNDRVVLNDLIAHYATDPDLTLYASKIRVVDAGQNFNPATDTDDGIHPNTSGIGKLGGAIAAVLDSLALHPTVAANGFDRDFYLLANPDVAAANANAYQHYDTYGAHEGRNPNAFFDTAVYLARNPDVAAAGVDPLDHYHQYGWHEGRDPSADFNTRAYLAANPDVEAAGVDPLFHYLAYGAGEGRAVIHEGHFLV